MVKKIMSYVKMFACAIGAVGAASDVYKSFAVRHWCTWCMMGSSFVKKFFCSIGALGTVETKFIETYLRQGYESLQVIIKFYFICNAPMHHTYLYRILEFIINKKIMGQILSLRAYATPLVQEVSA